MYPAQQNATDHTANFFWLIAIFFAAAILFWIYDEKYIVVPMFWLRVHEIDLMRILVNNVWMPIAAFFHLPLPDIQKLDALQHYMQTANPSAVPWKNFAAINVFLGRWTRYPVIVALIGMAVFMYFYHGSARFARTFNVRSLRKVGEEVWPQIAPIASLNLVKEDIDQGSWAMAKLPLIFCREHNLLSVKQVANKKAWSLKEKPTYRLFALQLGPLWKGLDALPIHVKALALIFLARATGNRPLSNQLLSQLAASSASGVLDFSGVSEKLLKYHDHKLVRWLNRHHAYVTTVMATMLEMARADGVLASAEFLWLKPVDRRLWYTLNSVGRRTAVVEVAGTFSHWQAERKVGRALKTPMVKSAVDALHESLASILYVEEEDRWHTSKED